MTWHCLTFEVNSIQRWIFGSGKLRAIVGGSKLVSGITDELLKATLEALAAKYDDRIKFARRAGGVFIALSENEAALSALRRVWPLMVSRYAPGLSFGIGYAQAEKVTDAMNRARVDIGARGALPQPNLPMATPVMERSRRTGLPAVSWDDKGEIREPIDAVTAAQFQAEKRATKDVDSQDIGAKLARKLSLDGDPWPRDMEPNEDGKAFSFPFLRNEGTIISRYVALVHADGNGLGQLLQKLEFGGGEDEIDLRFKFSEALEAATFEACRQACEQTLPPPEDSPNRMLPARPILLGGDDLSFIVRADLALHFTQAFLDAFERETRQRLSSIPGVPDEGLTACAGIAYLRSNQPFYMGMELAEALCGHAKKQVRAAVGKNMFSALCQYRCTDSLISDWDSLLENSLTLPAQESDDQRYRLSMETWALLPVENQRLPALGSLIELLDYLERPAISRGPARKLVGMIGQHPSLVSQKYARWLEILDKTLPKGKGAGYFKTLLGLNGYGEAVTNAPFIRPSWPVLDRDGKAICPTPLAEALALKAMGVKAWASKPEKEEESA